MPMGGLGLKKPAQSKKAGTRSCCNVLRCVAVWCSVVQCGAVCCSFAAACPEEAFPA